MVLLTSQPRWMAGYHHYRTQRHLISPRVQTGEVETARAAKLNVRLSLREPLKSLQTAPAAATIPRQVWANTKLPLYLEEDPTNFAADPPDWCGSVLIFLGKKVWVLSIPIVHLCSLCSASTWGINVFCLFKSKWIKDWRNTGYRSNKCDNIAYCAVKPVLITAMETPSSTAPFFTTLLEGIEI